MRKLIANIGRSAREVTLPIWTAFRRGAEYRGLSGRPDGLVVSLTTFPARITSLWITIDSLMRQTLRPDKISLALTREEFPGGLEDLPDSVLKFADLGLEIEFLPFNMRCHNKYIHALRNFPKATVVTVDDDCYYRADTLERLFNLHRKYPDAVCCNIAAVIDPASFYEYSSWKKSSSERPPGDLNVALGFAGVLYPPGLPLDVILDREKAMRLSPTADDLWLKAAELSSGVKVACGPFFPKPVTIKSSQRISLRKVNKGAQNRNDVQWKALDEHFHLADKI